MSRGSDVDQDSIGPISPELALVDPVLAERARKLLPDRREPPPLRRTTVGSVRPRAAAPEKRAPAPAPRSRVPRWKRMVALSALVFVAGAASAGLLDRRDLASPPMLLEERPGTGSVAVTRKSTHSPAQRTTSDRRTNRREATRGRRERRSPPSQAGVRRREQRLHAPVKWAANVLGVSAAVDPSGVTLEWQPPAGSDRVVVHRKLVAAKRSVILFRGRATGLRDTSPRPCSSYRYTIVSYDRAGHRSTGVPTSVVTGGCA